MNSATHSNQILYGLGLITGVAALLLFGAAVGLYANKFGEHLVLMLGTPLLIPLGLLLFVNPRLLFYVLIGTRCALDPILESARFSSSFGLGALLNMLLVACAVMISIQGDKARLKQSVLLWALPILVMIFGVTYAPDPLAALKRLIAFISYFSVFTVGMILFEEKKLRTLLRVVVMSSALPIAVGLYQLSTGSLSAEGRLAATFTHPNIFAFYCLLVLIALVYLRRTSAGPGESEPGRLESATHSVLFVLLLVSIVLTQTRSAWVALTLIALTYGVVFSRKTLLWLLLGLLLAALTPEVQERIVDLFSGNEVANYGKLNSFAWRQYIWESGLNWMNSSRYLLGYGIGGFYHYSPEFFPLSGGTHYGAHNVFVERFFDGGVLAVSVFAVFFLAQIRKAFVLIRHDHFTALVFLGMILSYLTLNASDNVVDYLAYNWYYWAVAGAFYAAACQATSSRLRS
ncbi:MAG: O-antigen ligase family protein [Limnobacter sp.]|uniref:O-antigen ligase family protein n=1 Tax=Limnobacter sp. TaxID=2003368 RepID=UPI0032EC5C77